MRLRFDGSATHPFEAQERFRANTSILSHRPPTSQFEALLPNVEDSNPPGCHQPRVPDRIEIDKLVNRLVLGEAYTRHVDHRVSATTNRARRGEWIATGVFSCLEQIVPEAFDGLIGLDMEHLTIDRYCVKAFRIGDITGANPTDRGKKGQKRSLLTEGHGLPIGVVLTGANRHDSPLLFPTLERLGRFGFHLPEQIRVDLDVGYDSERTR